MYIPNTAPASLADMLTFLQPGIETGLFDSVEYHYPDGGSDPDGILCSQDGNVLFRFAISNSTTSNFVITPYVNGVEAATQHRYESAKIDYAMRCTGGFCFISVSLSGSRYVFVIAKLSDGTTGSFKTSLASSPTTSNFSNTLSIFPTSYNDNTSLKMYTQPWKIEAVHALDMDRTIFAKIPFAGEYGSTGTFSTAFIRTAVQFYDNGEQIIGGKQYGCMYHIALLDE